MTDVQLAAALVSLAALFGYLNHRLLRLPPTIGMMATALLVSLLLLVVGAVAGSGPDNPVRELIRVTSSTLSRIDLSHLVLDVMLGFLLFAGALHVNLDDLLDRRYAIASFATASLAVSTVLVGTLLFLLLRAVGLPFSYLHCLLFGALISPTDPVAVLGIMRRARAPRSLEAKVVGESLFNDGLGVVLFLTLVGLVAGSGGAAAGGHAATGGGGSGVALGSTALFLLREVGGGAAFGLAAGWLGYAVLRSIDDRRLELLITLALAAGGYALAGALHLSAPLAMVVIGLLIGNKGRHLAMTDATRENLDRFWETLDELLNAVLFLLIGLELLVLPLPSKAAPPVIAAAALVVPIVLLSRWVGIGLPVTALRLLGREFSHRAVRIITWAGLRGGISVALALSLPAGQERDLFLVMTYVVVVFSILVQGLTLGRVVGGGRGSQPGSAGRISD